MSSHPSADSSNRIHKLVKSSKSDPLASGYMLPGEGIFVLVFSAILLVTWIGVALAVIGLFSPINLGVIFCAFALVGILLARPRVLLVFKRPQFDRVYLGLIIVVLLAIALDFIPTEHYPLVGDSAIYPNTAALLSETGGLSYHYTPIDGLNLSQKKLFYVPSDEQIPGLVIQGYQGLVYGAYYVMDQNANQIVSSRPPGFTVWMALFYALFGPQGTFWATPLFGVLAVVAIYLLGARLFGYQVGLGAAVILAVGFPQIHFSRTSYSEAMAQALTLASLFGMLSYLNTTRKSYLIFTAASLGALWVTRLDAIVILVPILFFCFVLLYRKDQAIIRVFLPLITLAMVFFVAITVGGNLPYTISTWQLFSSYSFTFLQYATLLITLVALASLLVAFLLYRFGSVIVPRIQKYLAHPLARGGAIAAIVTVSLYMFLFNPSVSDALYKLPHSQVLPQAGIYLTPLVFFAGIGGLCLMIWRGMRAEELVFSIFFLLFANLFLWKYTSAAVYPVALRRLIPEVIPALVLLASYTVMSLPNLLRWRIQNHVRSILQIVLMASIIASQLVLSWQYIFYQEAPGTVRFTETLAQEFPANAVIVFDPLGENSQVGWFASPLWSLYGKNALLLNKNPVSTPLFNDVINKWLSESRPIYYVTEFNPPPATLIATETDHLSWNSSIIGQSNLFPPYIWRFDMPIRIFKINSVVGDGN